MLISSWLRGWSSSARRVRPLATSSEILEQRLVLTVDVTDASEFVVSLSAADNVTIGVDDDGYVTVNGVSQETLAEEVTTLEVDATGLFKNKINLSGVDSRFSLLSGVSVSAGSGNDSVLGSPLKDTLIGGDGNDTLDGGLGDDEVDGSAGNDLVNGSAGNDSLEGGLGIDNVNGMAGDDVLGGGDGNDFLYGGGGKEWIAATCPL